LQQAYKEGISWGDAKNKLFEKVNSHLSPIREKYFELDADVNLINELLLLGAEKVRPQAQELLEKVRDSIGIKSIS
jgi:tryptophanyl-tRNA synthetase